MKIQILTLFYLLTAATGASLRRRNLEDRTSVQCRLTIIDTQMDETSEFENIEEAACVPIVHGKELDDLITVTLPEGFEEANLDLLEQGRLLVRITNAVLFRSDIAITPESEFIVTGESAGGVERFLQAGGNSATIGEKTIAIVRIHATDKSPTVSRQDLEDLFDENQINIRTQFDACSDGKLKWKLAGVHDVYVDKPVADYGTGSGAIVGAAHSQLIKDLDINEAKDLADRIMFCAPRGQGSWVASAPMNHWRAVFHDEWCVSLTAAMHELGHTIGLAHSNKGSVKYGDKTGNMAKSYNRKHGPQRCYDGRSSQTLGWYKDREMTIDNILKKRPQQIRLAGVVDYGVSAKDEAVHVTLPGNLYLMYNRKKTFNSGTGMMADMVTMTNRTSSGSDLLMGLSAGSKYEVSNYLDSGRTLVVEACYEVESVNDRTADVMVVSVGMDYSVCSEEAAEKETEFPTSAPTETPPLSEKEKANILAKILEGLRRPKKHKKDP